MKAVVYLSIIIYGFLPAEVMSTVASAPLKVTPAQIRALTEELYRLDTGSVGNQVSLRLGGITTSTSSIDQAPKKLFASVSAPALTGPTVAPLVALLDNYDRRVTTKEVVTPQEQREETTFITAIMATKVMKRTEKFLKAKGHISGSLGTVLRRVWLTPYPRGGRRLSSSGFEHVFVGEAKGAEVTGFHGWLSFYTQERKNKLNYFGYMKIKELGPKIKLLSGKFKWFTQTKNFGSMFVGISPELEMSLYTVCFFVREGKNCPVSLNNNRFNVKTFAQSYKGQKLIGSAFPNL